ncbi:MAG: InlB B-repeat-containing protein [Spirochaetota bacterium]
MAIVLVGCSNLLSDLQEPNPPALKAVLADLLPPLSDVDFSISRITAALGLAGATINGATVVWESSNPSVIASDGTIVRPPAGSDPIKVSVKARVKWGTVTKEKVFEVTVAPMPAALADQIAEDRDAVQALPVGSTADTLVEENLRLPSTGACGSTIAWASSDTSLIANDGSVTRPAFGSANGTVTMTATITKDGQTSTKTIEVKVNAALPTAAQAVDIDVAALTVSSLGTDTDPTQIKTSLFLPSSGTKGSTISWTSSDTTAVEADGTVIRPASGSGSKTVTLTATVTSGSTVTTKTFNVTVLEVPATAAASVSEDKVNLVSRAIKGANPDLSRVSRDLHLPKSGSAGTAITWESSNTAVISATGKVTLPSSESGDQPATLTATLTKEGVTETTTLTATVTCMTRYTVTFDGQSATTEATPTTVFVAPPVTTITALPTDPARTGYDFGGWWTAAAGTGFRFRASTAVAANVTVYAKWTATGGSSGGGGDTGTTSYAITYNLDSGTNSGSNPATYNVTTASITLAAPTRTGYSFGGWYTEVGLTNVATTLPLGSTGAKAFWATWTATGGSSGGGGGGTTTTGQFTLTVGLPTTELNRAQLL